MKLGQVSYGIKKMVALLKLNPIHLPDPDQLVLSPTDDQLLTRIRQSDMGHRWACGSGEGPYGLKNYHSLPTQRPACKSSRKSTIDEKLVGFVAVKLNDERISAARIVIGRKHEKTGP